jgi:hypothetical protein
VADLVDPRPCSLIRTRSARLIELSTCRHGTASPERAAPAGPAMKDATEVRHQRGRVNCDMSHAVGTYISFTCKPKSMRKARIPRDHHDRRHSPVLSPRGGRRRPTHPGGARPPGGDDRGAARADVRPTGIRAGGRPGARMAAPAAMVATCGPTTTGPCEYMVSARVPADNRQDGATDSQRWRGPRRAALGCGPAHRLEGGVRGGGTGARTVFGALIRARTMTSVSPRSPAPACVRRSRWSSIPLAGTGR